MAAHYYWSCAKQLHSVRLWETADKSDAVKNATVGTLVIVESQRCDLPIFASVLVEYSGWEFLCNVAIHEKYILT